MLYRILDKVINLTQCEVYSYNPDMESDPHADSDSDSDVSSEHTSEAGDDDVDGFVFHDFSSSPPKHTSFDSKYSYLNEQNEDVVEDRYHPQPIRRKSQGGLLWSSHWFFHNKKQKRILFITIWAKKRSGWSSLAESGLEGAGSFVPWEGGVGAGARAMGLRSNSK